MLLVLETHGSKLSMFSQKLFNQITFKGRMNDSFT